MSTFIAPPLDFDVIKEIWNKYDLVDHTLLKVKIVLTMVVKAQNPSPNAPGGTQGYNVDAQTIIVAITNECGQPDTRMHTAAEINAAITKHDMRFDTLTQDWNEYVVDDGTRIKIQPVLMSVSKTSLFNNKGMPMYVTSINMNVQMKPPGSRLQLPSA